MMMSRVRSATVACAILLGLSACKQTTEVNIGPTGPTNNNDVVGVQVDASIGSITLGACPAQVTFTAKVLPASANQAVTWVYAGDEKMLARNGNQATLSVDRAGTYTLTARSAQKPEKSGQATVVATGSCGGVNPPTTPPPPPPPPPPPVAVTCDLDATPDSIMPGGSSLLTWNSNGLVTFTQGLSGIRPSSGSQTVSPTSTTTYIISCVGSDGEEKNTPRTVIVGSNPPPPPPAPMPTCSIFATPMSVAQGGQSTLRWDSTNATSVTSNFDTGNIGLTGSRTVVLAATQTFTITCIGPGGSATASVTVTVTGPGCPTSISYVPTNGGGNTIGVNQTKGLRVQNWPSSTSCVPFWYVDRPDVAQINGADSLVIIDGATFYAGVNAVLKGIWTGTVSVCVQTSLVIPETKQCQPWTVTAADAASLMSEVSPQLKYMNVAGVSQVYIPIIIRW